MAWLLIYIVRFGSRFLVVLSILFGWRWNGLDFKGWLLERYHLDKLRTRTGLRRRRGDKQFRLLDPRGAVDLVHVYVSGEIIIILVNFLPFSASAEDTDVAAESDRRYQEGDNHGSSYDCCSPLLMLRVNWNRMNIIDHRMEFFKLQIGA